jgi:Ca-activated chloride channel family protein
MALLPTVRWEYPAALWCLALLPLLAALLAYGWILQRRLLQRWSQVAAVRSHSMLPSLRTELQRAFCLLSGFALAVLGFASPMLSSVHLEPAWERVALGLILDVSPSMRAPANPQMPTGPSRIDLLKQTALDLFEHLPNGVRVGIVAFAGVSVPIVSQPSADHQAIIAKIRRLEPTFIVNPGSNLAAAVQQGLSLFVDTTLDTKPDTVSLILLSDGDSSITPALQHALQQTPIPIYTLGIGAPQPARIPAPQRTDGFLTNQAGQALTTVVNASVLRFIAEQTGGMYYPAAQRVDLSQRLRQLVDSYGQRVAEPVQRPRSARRGLFFAAFCSILLYQFQTRTGRLWTLGLRSPWRSPSG